MARHSTDDNVIKTRALLEAAKRVRFEIDRTHGQLRGVDLRIAVFDGLEWRHVNVKAIEPMPRLERDTAVKYVLVLMDDSRFEL